MAPWVVWFVAIVGAAHLAAHYGAGRPLAGTLKVLPILVLAAVTASRPSLGPGYAVLITAGLLASAVGDFCLVWPERFTAGLASFLLAHCCYLVAFAGGAGGGGAAWPWVIGIAAGTIALVAVLWPHLGRVRAPVLV